jgi:head-tail adaptor
MKILISMSLLLLALNVSYAETKLPLAVKVPKTTQLWSAVDNAVKNWCNWYKVLLWADIRGVDGNIPGQGTLADLNLSNETLRIDAVMGIHDNDILGNPVKVLCDVEASKEAGKWVAVAHNCDYYIGLKEEK